MSSATSSQRLVALPQRNYLVIGGSGFLGRTIVEALVERGECVRVFDLAQTYSDARVDFVRGDIRDADDVLSACVGIETVFHCASLADPWAQQRAFFDVNVRGTKNVISACMRAGTVRRLVYTSTASVVIDGTDIQNGDEAMPYPRYHLDTYSASKAHAERLVIGANGSLNANGDPLLTCSLRLHALFGPRDQHFVARLIAKARQGGLTHIIGAGDNLVDFTYVDNAAAAHLRAADHLLPDSAVCGQCYFITNGEPVLFWDFVGYILSETGCAGPESFVSFSMAYAFAYLMDWIKWLVGWAVTIGPTITRHMVCTMSQHHFFSHAKATRDFGYTPHISLDDALRITIAHFTQLPASAANASAIVGSQSLSASPLPLLSSPLSTSPVGALRGRSISIAAFPASAVLALAQTAPASAFRLVGAGAGRDGGLAADNENASQSEGRRASVLQPIVDFASSRGGATFVRRAFSHQSLSSLARDDR